MLPVSIINDQGASINCKLKSALNKFFLKYPDCLEGCILRKKFDNSDYSLIIEESDLYSYLSGEYGWAVHTDFYKAFEGSGYFPEPYNSCQINFYKD